MDGEDFLVETRDFTKRYGSRIVAEDGVNLMVQRGASSGYIFRYLRSCCGSRTSWRGCMQTKTRTM